MSTPMPTFDDTDIERIEERVDSLESRMTAVEVQIKTGFQDLKALMQNLFSEKVAWGKFARDSLRAIGVWLAKWGAIVLLAAIGCNQILNIYKALH